VKIAIAQMNALVGDLAGNAARIVAFADEARSRGATLMATPELALCGYPPEGLLLRDDFMARCSEALADIARRVSGITLVVGHPRLEHGRRHNSASVLRDGRTQCVYDKNNLPNYTIFDEERYFEACGQPCIFSVDEETPGSSGWDIDAACNAQANEFSRIGINICADAWHIEPPRRALEAGARILLVLNASPYHIYKQELREKILRQRAAETGLSIVYVNMVGGQDELVFDGASFVMNGEGRVTQQLPAFEEQLALVDLVDGEPVPGSVAPRLKTQAAVYSALVLGVRDYVRKNDFRGALVGLCGEIDSALTLAIAVDALGADKVRAVMMPNQARSKSAADARRVAENLGVRYTEVNTGGIAEAYRAALPGEAASESVNTCDDILHARIRGTALAALADRAGAIVLTTGNKSEMGTGCAMFGGDIGGGFAVLKDVHKMLVYALARYRNGITPVIPASLTEARPSAGPNDASRSRTLPPYPVVDAILEAYIEREVSPADIVALGHSRADVERVVGLVCTNEYRRRQAPIGLRVTRRAVGKDWRYPITHGFRHRC
jgi:NAD+ synthase (glutamine-hydrolysing)